MTDGFPKDNSFKVTNLSGTVVFNNSTQYTKARAEYYESKCLPAGAQYTFFLYDSLNGLCCMNGNGYFQVYWDGVLQSHPLAWNGTVINNTKIIPSGDFRSLNITLQ